MSGNFLQATLTGITDRGEERMEIYHPRDEELLREMKLKQALLNRLLKTLRKNRRNKKSK